MMDEWRSAGSPYSRLSLSELLVVSPRETEKKCGMKKKK
jgi:hypothetical protein